MDNLTFRTLQNILPFCGLLFDLPNSYVFSFFFGQISYEILKCVQIIGWYECVIFVCFVFFCNHCMQYDMDSRVHASHVTHAYIEVNIHAHTHTRSIFTNQHLRLGGA